MRVPAYAKINIGLRINSKRADGFHDIDSYFARISLADYIDLSAESAPSTSITINSDTLYLDNGRTDLMEKAAMLFSERTNKHFNLIINIEKHIPSKAGLGGGSSDGAAVLCALNGIYGNILSRTELMELSLKIGSDLPFFVSGCSVARVRGRGELVEKTAGLSDYSGVIVFMPEQGNSTGTAYSYIDSLNRAESVLPALSDDLSYESFPNDFALVDGELQNAVSAAFPDEFASLSGSGSAVYMLIKRSSDYDRIWSNAEAFAVDNQLKVYRSELI